MAASAAGIRERSPVDRKELPLVASIAECQLEHAMLGPAGHAVVGEVRKSSEVAREDDGVGMLGDDLVEDGRGGLVPLGRALGDIARPDEHRRRGVFPEPSGDPPGAPARKRDASAATPARTTRTATAVMTMAGRMALSRSRGVTRAAHARRMRGAARRGSRSSHRAAGRSRGSRRPSGAAPARSR